VSVIDWGLCWSYWLILTPVEGQVDGNVVNVAIVTFTESVRNCMRRVLGVLLYIFY
jgi:hypothetical protein